MLTFSEAAQRTDSFHDDAARLGRRGVPGVVLPASAEEAFYRYGNLPEQLRRLFSPVRPARIDEDVLELLAAQAQALIRTTYLMDDAVQTFYRALNRAALRGPVEVRRAAPAAPQPESALFTPPGTPVLQAVKRLWAQDWAFGAVLARLDDTGSVALEARDTLIHPPLAEQPAAQPHRAL